MSVHSPQHTELVIPILPPTDKPVAYDVYAFQIITSAFSIFGFPLSNDRFETLKRYFATQLQRNSQPQLKLHLTIAGDDVAELGISFLIQRDGNTWREIERVSETLGIAASDIRFSEVQEVDNSGPVEFFVTHLKSEYSYEVYNAGWNLHLAW